MPLSIGVNLRVTGHCNQGGRKYMEDMFSVAYQQSSNDRELEYAFFGIFDGHGGGEAATFAKENLMDIIVKQKNFWSDNDEDVLKAIRDGYVNTHYAMWRELDKWPRTASGLPSTAGTTASIAFIRKGKIYIGHVGDSGIILGYQEKGNPLWKSKPLTRDHKPECGVERTRIQESGGKVVIKSGVPRVVWNRPRLGHKGPVRRSTHIDEIPFLAVARSLGDLWSYNSELNTFVVSPEPDVKVVKIDVKSHRCLIFGTDGLWNMLSPQAAVAIVQAAERHNEKHVIASQQTGNGQAEVQMWINPSKSLVDRALDKWSSTRFRADNTSVVTLMLDPPGPTHNEILLSQKREQMATNRTSDPPVPRTPEPQVQPSDCVHSPYPSDVPRPEPDTPEAVPCPYPYPSMPIKPPSYNDVQKHPDSSDQPAQAMPSPATTSSAEVALADASEPSPLPLLEESIQVAEISSSNVTDDQQGSADEVTSIVDAYVNSLCADAPREVDDLVSDTAGIADSGNWLLQQVPEAEKFSEDPVDLQPIRMSEPTGPRLRRSVHETLPKRLSENAATTTTTTTSTSCVVIRQTRRHSSGTSQQATQQRRIITTKSTLKRSSRFMLSQSEFAEPRVGVGTANGYDAKESGEPCPKRRTRSEDVGRRNTQDENAPANQKLEQQHSRLSWRGSETSIARSNGVLSGNNSMQERRLSSPNSFKRRNMEKKVTPVKTIRRPSITRSSTTGRVQMRDGCFWDQSRRQTVASLVAESLATASASPKRWLRSDTIAATPTKTLRSRNVDLGVHTVPGPLAIKPTARLLDTSAKLKQTGAPAGLAADPAAPQTPVVAKVKSTSCASGPSSTATPNRTKQNCSVSPVVGGGTPSCSSSSGSISKRAKTPYNPSARSLSTRSRIKRFSK